ACALWTGDRVDPRTDTVADALDGGGSDDAARQRLRDSDRQSRGRCGERPPRSRRSRIAVDRGRPRDRRYRGAIRALLRRGRVRIESRGNRSRCVGGLKAFAPCLARFRLPNAFVSTALAPQLPRGEGYILPSSTA